MKKKKLINTVAGTALAASLTLTGMTGTVNAEEAGNNALQEMKSMTTSNFNVVWNKNKSAPSFVSGKLSKQQVHGVGQVKQYLEENKELFKLDPDSDVTFVEKKKDELGMTHYKFMQSVDGVPVYGSAFTVHTNKKGIISAVTGTIHPKAAKTMESSKAELSKRDAIEEAWKSIDLSKKETKVKKTDKKELKKASKLSKSGVKNTAEKAELVVYSNDGQSHLAYHVELQFIYPDPGNWQIFVDANDGSVIDSYNAVTDAGAANGYGYGVLGDYKQLNTYLSNGYYFLYDVTNPMNGVIETFTAENGSSLPGYRSSDSNNAFTSGYQAAAVDAHAYADQVYDYYYNTFGRNSYDGNGASIRSTVHYGNNYNNAFWNGQQMVYGDGDGTTFAPLSGALDVVAHELTHAVTGHTAGLVYRDQPGALNESMSDVFSVFVERQDYLLGEDVYTPYRSGDALRSLSNPPAYGQPEHMNDYVYTNADNGGVHTNSGIPNKAGYNTIESIGVAKAEKIYYRALSIYLGPYSNFSDARAALLQSAADLYGYGSEYNAVADAWNNVGVY
ncbi:M4 family metallopeptidase [Virgibacillus siamensis]|uniref:M4 family metallopeptidase n=1 Tax=Virgibacillus siamensis TaxID=480071 RepID=UPI001FED00AC|nr:M4 family metallopeptidase [Virgibacillus siamensis]